MRTTIVVEDAAGAPDEAPAEQPGLPVDAGAAPVDEDGRVGTGDSSLVTRRGSDGGMPPTWLVEAIAGAGGMTAPVSPEDIELAGLDAGSAPA